MNIKAQKQAVIDNQAVDRDLLLESIAMLPEQVIKNVEAISHHIERLPASSVSLLSSRLFYDLADLQSFRLSKRPT
jgi:hypothetical protein